MLLLLMCIGAVNVSAPDHFSEGVNPALLTSVSCTGTETEILECGRVTSSRALPCDTAGVVCQGVSSSIIMVDDTCFYLQHSFKVHDSRHT